MTPDRNEEAPDENVEHGVLDDIGSLDTASISILGGHIAQVSVDLPPASDDDADDDVVEDELPIDDGLVPDFRSLEPAVDPSAEGDVASTDDVDATTPASHDAATTTPAGTPVDEVATGDIILEPHGADISGEASTDDVDTPDVHDAELVTDDAPVDDVAETVSTDEDAREDHETSHPGGTLGSDADPAASDADEPADEVRTPVGVSERAEGRTTGDDSDADAVPAADAAPGEVATAPGDAAEPRAGEPAASASAEAPMSVEAPAAATPSASAESEPTPPITRAARAVTGAIGTVPLTRRDVHHADDAARLGRAHAVERVRTATPDVSLTSKRLGELDDARESPDLLTADRLLDPRQIERPEPEGAWQHLVYAVSRHRINLGDGRRARQRKELDRRIAAPLAGEARFVPVLSRKGGVGKTTITSLLGMALADAREDRVIAVDANPDRGTLADRVGRPNGRTVRDLVRAHDEVAGYSDVSSIVARDATRLDVLASDADPRVSEAFNDEDYRQVADVAAHYYSLVLTDTGTGVVHSVMEATLERASTLVVVAGLSVDEARLASETLTWLETNGYADRVRDAVVVLNASRPGAPLVREDELDAHFRSRVRSVIRMPYDPHIAAGSAIAFRDLRPATRNAARELAASVVEGLRARAVAA